ncbi:MAG: carbohydrate ABC transporter permease [Candidatus Atribacteria bacterium]|nr:carbohydrate ABC transporter permease [Candidatus Atribacteria bacterium]MCD6350048.1 carbohydrate ABC transporter permease [Candidatus Atribacteria bacterium]
MASKGFTKVATWVILFFLVLWAIAELFPIVFLYMTAMKSDEEIMNNILLPPRRPSFRNFVLAWRGGNLGIPISRYFLNSVIVTGGTLLFLTILGAMAGYGLSRYLFPGKSFFQKFLIFALAVPAHATLIPVFHFLGRFGLRNNYLGLIFVYTAFWLPFTILMLYSYFGSFPKELEDAAKIDGLSELGTFFRVVVPVSKGALSSVSIVNFVGIWSELLFAFLIMNREKMKTITVGVLSFRGQYEVQWSFMFATMAIAALPTIIFFLIFQRQITKGMLLGSFR